MGPSDGTAPRGMNKDLPWIEWAFQSMRDAEWEWDNAKAVRLTERAQRRRDRDTERDRAYRQRDRRGRQTDRTTDGWETETERKRTTERKRLRQTMRQTDRSRLIQKEWHRDTKRATKRIRRIRKGPIWTGVSGVMKVTVQCTHSIQATDLGMLKMNQAETQWHLKILCRGEYYYIIILDFY